MTKHVFTVLCIVQERLHVDVIDSGLKYAFARTSGRLFLQVSAIIVLQLPSGLVCLFEFNTIWPTDHDHCEIHIVYILPRIDALFLVSVGTRLLQSLQPAYKSLDLVQIPCRRRREIHTYSM